MQQSYWLMNMHVWNSFLKRETIVWTHLYLLSWILEGLWFPLQHSMQFLVSNSLSLVKRLWRFLPHWPEDCWNSVKICPYLKKFSSWLFASSIWELSDKMVLYFPWVCFAHNLEGRDEVFALSIDVKYDVLPEHGHIVQQTYFNSIYLGDICFSLFECCSIFFLPLGSALSCSQCWAFAELIMIKVTIPSCSNRGLGKQG